MTEQESIQKEKKVEQKVLIKNDMTIGEIIFRTLS